MDSKSVRRGALGEEPSLAARVQPAGRNEPQFCARNGAGEEPECSQSVQEDGCSTQRGDVVAAKASEISGQQKSFDALYAALRSGLGPGVVGKFVVINIRSGRYLIAPTSKAALALAEREFGSTDWCWTRRIGPR